MARFRIASFKASGFEPFVVLCTGGHDQKDTVKYSPSAMSPSPFGSIIHSSRRAHLLCSLLPLFICIVLVHRVTDTSSSVPQRTDPENIRTVSELLSSGFLPDSESNPELNPIPPRNYLSVRNFSKPFLLLSL